jgi:hypothetical protein
MQTGKVMPGGTIDGLKEGENIVVSSKHLNPSITPRPVNEILANALRNGIKAFILGYSIRSGLSFLLKLTSVARGRAKLIDAFKSSFGGEDGLRFGTFFGAFAFLWKCKFCSVIITTKQERNANFETGGLHTFPRRHL